MMMELLWVLDELLMTSLFLFIVSVFIDRIFPTVLVDEIFLGVADAIAGLRSGDRIVVVGSDEEEENQEGGVGDIDFGKLVEEEEEDEAVDMVSEGEIGMDEAVGEIRLEDKEVKLSEHDDTGVDDDDDWEGIEQTPTGELFAIANDYFGSTVGKEELSGLGPDVQLQVYALSKVAIDGPCYGPQPLSLKPSSRARWHAWRNLGDMSPEQAMDEYLTLLCANISGWGESRSRIPANCSATSCNEQSN